VTSLANALHESGARFALAYDLWSRTFVPLPAQPIPWVIPLPVLFDLQKLIRWFADNPEVADRLDEASAVTRTIRQFTVPAYQVVQGDEQVLQTLQRRPHPVRPGRGVPDGPGPAGARPAVRAEPHRRALRRLRLPPWFSNLLPEGRLRDWIAADRKVSADREMELLAQVGHDLPGAVRVLPDETPGDRPTWDTCLRPGGHGSLPARVGRAGDAGAQAQGFAPV
jgi:HipA N-terminal domain